LEKIECKQFLENFVFHVEKAFTEMQKKEQELNHVLHLLSMLKS